MDLSILKKQIKIDIRKQKLLFVGILGVILMYVGVAGMISTNAPWLVRGDTTLHVDYVWRLHNGEIPKRSDGITYQPFVEHAGKSKAQLASKNPPLFYSIHAPFVGPLLNSGNWELGIAVGRTINIVIGVFTILALAWGGWLLGGVNRRLHAIAVPAVTILIYRFTRLNVDFAVDGLLVLFATLSLIFSYKILKKGPDKKLLLIITLLSIAGMYTKVAYLPFVMTSLLAIAAAVFIHSKDTIKKKVSISLKLIIGIFVAVAVSVGWYYYIYNYQVSGHWYTARPDGATGGRPVKSLIDLTTSSDFWGLLYKNFARNELFSVALASFSIAGIMTIKKGSFRKVINNKAMITIVGIMFLAVFGTFLVQIKHAWGIGSINFRYILPVLLPVGLFLSYGLLQYKKTRGAMVTIAAIFMGATSIGAYKKMDSGYFENENLDKLLGGYYGAGADNGVPSIAISFLLISFIVGSILLAMSLYKLSKESEQL